MERNNSGLFCITDPPSENLSVIHLYQFSSLTFSCYSLKAEFPLVIQQFRALFKKNFLISWRNYRATCLRIFLAFFLLFFIFCINKVVNPWLASSAIFKKVFDLKPLDFTSIPPCEEIFFIKLLCFDFPWRGNGSARVQAIVNKV